MTDAVIATADEPQTAIFGQPRGVFYLAFTEAWERFSFYGMQALLVLYLVNSLLKPGNAERVVGLEALRRGLETILGRVQAHRLSGAGDTLARRLDPAGVGR